MFSGNSVIGSDATLFFNNKRTWLSLETAISLTNNILEDKTIDNITKILDRVDSAMKRGGNNRLSRQIERIELNMDDPKFNGTTKNRIQKLNSILKDIAQKLKR